MAWKSFYDTTTGALPTLIADERVQCNNSVTIDGSTYYEGWLTELTTDSIFGASSTTTGAYTSISKAGTRYTVIANLPSTNEVMIDLMSGRLLTSTEVTLYFTYYAYGRIYKWWELGGELRHVVDRFCDFTADTVVYQEQVWRPTRFVAGQVVSRTTIFSATFTIRVKNLTTGEYKDVTLTAGTEYGMVEFATTILFQKNDIMQFIVLANTSGVQSPALILYRG